jgi:signal peptidase I
MKFLRPSRARQWQACFLAAVLICLLLCLRTRYRLAVVWGESMRPGLNTGDVLLVDRQVYSRNQPQRGDVVLARYRNELIVKRLVGLPGEKVELKDGRLYINGSRVPEPYLLEPGWLSIEPGKLFRGRFALAGDNRSIPLCQTIHAVVSKGQIMGKVVFALPLGRISRSLG